VIVYTDDVTYLRAEELAAGFFDGWPHSPTTETHVRLLQGSYKVWLARDESGKVVGFINAISDGVLAAFIPLLEVVPSHKGQGIGSELVRRMLDSLKHLYSIDIVCDADLEPFYAQFGLRKYNAMITRHYERQSGG
jgi:ribosomal protein S18 acetylase RimI-like enzyme